MKIEIKKHQTSMGYAYGIFIDGEMFDYVSTFAEAQSLINLINQGYIDVKTPFRKTESE